MEFEAVIGLEVHAQLKTKTKIFCACSTAATKQNLLRTLILDLEHFPAFSERKGAIKHQFSKPIAINVQPVEQRFCPSSPSISTNL